MNRKFKNFNNLSEEFRKELPTLEHGEVVTFHMLTGVVNNDPDTTQRERNPIFYPKARIPMRDRVFDKYQGTNGKFIEIGVVTEDDGENPTRFLRFCPGEGESRFNGKFSLTGGNGMDDEIFQFLWVSNYNAGKEKRDTKEAPLFEYVDVIADSKKHTKKYDDLYVAMELANDMTDGEIRDFASAMNFSTSNPIEVIRTQVKQFAIENPEDFGARLVNPDTKLRALINKANAAGHIKFDALTYKVAWGKNDTVFATLIKQEGLTWQDTLVQWLNTAENGQQVQKQINGLIRNNAKTTVQ